MLNEIPVSRLKIGMSFSEPLYFDEVGNIFLSENQPVSKQDLDLLKKWKFKHVFSNQTFLGLTDNRQTPQDTDKTKVSLQKIEVHQIYAELVSEIHIVFEKLKQRQNIQDKPISNIVEKLKKFVEDYSYESVGLVLNSDIKNNEIAQAAINTAILCYIIGKQLNLSSDEIQDLLTAAVLHDIGMLRVSEDIIQKNTSLTDMEIQTIKAHPSYGFKCTVSELMYTEVIGKIIMQHHEHWDGTGYPAKLLETQIDLSARILAVADAFVAMTSPKTYRQTMSGYDAMKNLIADNGQYFDPTVIKSTVQSLGIYPIGSVVLLNNSAICMVTKNDIKTPLRPKLRVIIDENGKQFENQAGEEINLGLNQNLFILKAIDTKDYK